MLVSAGAKTGDREPGLCHEQFVWLRRRQRLVDFTEVVVSWVCVHGCGAVSPAGWGMAALRESVANGAPLPTGSLPCPGRKRALQAKRVPAPKPPPEFLRSPRLRRASPISHFVV